MSSRCHNAIVIGDLQKGRNTEDDQNKVSADAREVQNYPKFQLKILIQVVDRVIGRTFTGGVTVVVSFNQFIILHPPHLTSPSQARLEVGVIDTDKAIDTGIMIAVALALVFRWSKYSLIADG